MDAKNTNPPHNVLFPYVRNTDSTTQPLVIRADLKDIPQTTARWTGPLPEALARFRARFHRNPPAVVYRWDLYWCFEVEK